ncbi:hypothetical protein B5X24_HaOG215392 [Helicoverpa armigera]|uniref:Uncharacterized protein n=1 Tax=Helicoverpa armigera TaxID=29058 RepID=A0A2W1B904_HELAM|nr:hypothetical protein B5X24_HaOG215392 [Helicoverpa armigera]
MLTIMKSCILFALLAALASCVHAAAVPTNLPTDVPTNPPTVAGEVQPGDSRLAMGEHMRSGEPNDVVIMHVVYRLGASHKVNAVIMTELGAAQGGAPAFVGGLGSNEISVVLVSARGRGLHYRVELWGDDTSGAGSNPPTVTVLEL